MILLIFRASSHQVLADLHMLNFNINFTIERNHFSFHPYQFIIRS